MPLLLRPRQNETRNQLASALHRQRLAIGERIDSDGKLVGLDPQTVCDLRAATHVVLCEADGAAGRSLKTHGPGEPVIPACSTHLLVVAGLDVLGRAAGPEVIHRIEHYEAITGGRPGEPVNAKAVASALRAAAQFAPPGSLVTFILNKAEGATRRRAGRAVAVQLRELLPGARVIVTQLEPLEHDVPPIYSV
jgi:probable selenium-dependent hydroxylase accessory protein YqeC